MQPYKLSSSRRPCNLETKEQGPSISCCGGAASLKIVLVVVLVLVLEETPSRPTRMGLRCSFSGILIPNSTLVREDSHDPWIKIPPRCSKYVARLYSSVGHPK